MIVACLSRISRSWIAQIAAFAPLYGLMTSNMKHITVNRLFTKSRIDQASLINEFKDKGIELKIGREERQRNYDGAGDNENEHYDPDYDDNPEEMDEELMIEMMDYDDMALNEYDQDYDDDYDDDAENDMLDNPFA